VYGEFFNEIKETKVKIFLAVGMLLVFSLASAEMMEGEISSMKIAPTDQSLEITLDNSTLRCTTVVLQKSANMFEERYALLLAAMLSQKKVAIWVSGTSCTANDSNPGTTIIN